MARGIPETCAGIDVTRFVLTSAVPLIILALLVFVLLALAGVVLLSLAVRYRAGTARRQARRWVASLNVWVTSFSALFFLSFTLLLSFWVGSAFRFALIGMAFGGILGLVGFSDDPLGKPTRRTLLHSEPMARTSRHVGNRSTFCLWLVARGTLRQPPFRRSALADRGLRNAAFRGSRCRIDSVLSGLLDWSAPANGADGSAT